tara:strand:+ start:648 stop:1124 length:477 start_codon:yes stop_codon:yes gene_type:complete
MATKKFKIPPKKIDSSDCVVHIGQRISDGAVIEKGDPYKIHEEEWVKVIPIVTMGESIALMNVSNLSADGEGANESFETICSALANKIVDWNWTDISGEELPKPYKNPSVFKELNTEELVYLVTISTGETPSEQKNESKDSPNTHLAEANKLNNLPSR